MGVQITLRVTDPMFESIAEVQKKHMHPTVNETIRMILGEWLFKWREEKYGSEIGVQANDQV